MKAGSGQSAITTLMPWDPVRYLRSVEQRKAALSRGFLQCRAERWFPGFAAQWLPLAHSLGLEAKIVEVQPLITLPGGVDFGYCGTVDGEPIGLYTDSNTYKAVLEAVSTGGAQNSQDVVMEYMARRLIGSLSLSWSGPQSSRVMFDRTTDPFKIQLWGAVRLGFLLNNVQCVVWIGLGEKLVDRFDNLWRKQIRSTTRNLESLTISMEVGHLSVAPSMLVDYLRAGTVIDLEIPMSETINLYAKNRPWFPARLCRIDDYLGFEIIPGTVPPMETEEGSTRLSLRFGTVTLDPQGVCEMSQVGSILKTGSKVSNSVEMVVNNEKVGEGTLCCYEGRFAVSVR